jgi:phytoene synthase
MECGKRALVIVKTSLQQAYLFCKQKTQREAKNFYYAFLLLPKEKRSAIYVAYTFAREVDDIVDEPSSHKEEQLEHFRQQLRNLYELKPSPPSSPLFLALGDVIQQFNIPSIYFLQLIEGMAMDLTQKRYHTFEELYQYCYKVAAVVGFICIYIFRFTDQACLPYAEKLGIAMQLTNILRDIHEDTLRDRLYLPLEELQRFQISEESLFNAKVDPEAFHAFMEFQIQRAQRYFQEAQPLLTFLEKDARICPKILQKLYQEILYKIQQRPSLVLTQRIRIPSPQKILLLFLALWDRDSP